ncbi:MAG: carbohydrate ABC transporter permease [Firmicutes bacterium]|nr:carbohydrate ABC transporter permease [Bacillota bacterium]
MLSIKRKSIGDILWDVVIYVVLTILSLMMVIPFIYVIVASFARESLIQSTSLDLFWKIFQPIGTHSNAFTLDAYKEVFDMSGIGVQVLRSLAISICVTVVGTVLDLIFTTTMAYGLSRSSLVGKKPILNVVLFTMVFSGGMIPLFLVVQGLGLYDSYAALILPGLISAYNMLIVRNFFMELPAGLEEAASIDGCTDIGIFFKIALPLSMPILATFGLMYGVGIWNNYFDALLYLDDSSKYPFQLVLRNIVNQSAADLDSLDDLPPSDTLKMAVIVIGTVPILCVYPFLQKYFAAGVMVGAIKG